ncbi:SufS family cysteine desulfurase, partial [Candidatus Binatia bacterium]|nr:SufS family cysteine desulfurase [Candidatus Binatia bacterium]
ATTATPDAFGEPFAVPSSDVHGALPRLHDFDPTPASVPAPGALPAPVTPDFYFLTPSTVTALPAQPTAAVAEPTPEVRSLYAPVAETPPPLGSSISRRPFDIAEIRRDFPILEERVHGKRLVWLDNAATTHKPTAVLDRMRYYYEHEYSNVHRAAHTLAARSTDAYEAAREKVARFLHASSPAEIVFVRGTTEGVNLVANAWGRKNLVEGDEIILSTLEHHSNIVPWQFLAQQTGAKLRVIPVTDRGEVLLSDYGKLLGPRTKLVAVTHVSNALGTILPVREITAAAHRHGATVLIDGAQAVSHFPVDVQEIGADFYVLSGHKLFAPTGVGVVYGRKAILDEMEPWQGGGNMIERVTFERSTFADAPMRFEAGTATLADAVGLGAAVDYLTRLGMDNVARHEHDLLAYATHELSRISGIRLIGTAPNKAGVVSFIADGIPAEEFGKMLDQDGIAVRAGHHCAQPTMDRFGVTSTVRPSLALYNDHHDVDALVRSVKRILVEKRGRA